MASYSHYTDPHKYRHFDFHGVTRPETATKEDGYRILAAQVIIGAVDDLLDDDEDRLTEAREYVDSRDFELWCKAAELDASQLRAKLREMGLC